MVRRLEIIDWEDLAVKCHGNVASMAATILVSRKTLERHFHDRWNTSPARWAKKVMLNKALELLRQGYSNKAVVGDLKLCSESWLCREFKKLYGASPQSYRLLRNFDDANRTF
jgi:transcriptional regulator GlxA family with amidase domain